MKSSNDGPSASVAAKVGFSDAVGLDVAGVAKERTCLITEARARREWVRMRDIVSRRVLNRQRLPETKHSSSGPASRAAIPDPTKYEHAL